MDVVLPCNQTVIYYALSEVVGGKSLLVLVNYSIHRLEHSIFSNCLRLFSFNTSVSSPAFARTTAPKMTEAVDVDIVSNFAQNANVIATSSGDFGGAFYPVAGLVLLGALILYLSPPLADE